MHCPVPTTHNLSSHDILTTEGFRRRIDDPLDDQELLARALIDTLPLAFFRHDGKRRVFYTDDLRPDEDRGPIVPHTDWNCFEINADRHLLNTFRDMIFRYRICAHMDARGVGFLVPVKFWDLGMFLSLEDAYERCMFLKGYWWEIFDIRVRRGGGTRQHGWVHTLFTPKFFSAERTQYVAEARKKAIAAYQKALAERDPDRPF